MALVLDCTFRDGGYYTHWDFDPSLVEQYFQTIPRLAVDTVEVGYVGNAAGQYNGRFYYLTPNDCAQYKRLLRPNQRLAVMLNLKEFKPSEVRKHFRPYLGYVDLVRMAVPPEQVHQANALAEELCQQGFQVGMNLMYLSRYAQDVPSVLAGAQSTLYACVSLVDSYGACFPYQVKQAVAQAKASLSVPIGFHGHNNIELAFANALAAMEAGVDCLDSTITGMGRGAGNLKTELLLSYLEQGGADPDNASDLLALGALVERFEGIQREFGWGSNLPYIVAGLNGLPQKEVMDWLGKARYSTSAIVAALRGASSEQHIDREVHPALPPHPPSTAVLIVGGGPSVQQHTKAIARFIQEKNALVVHSSLRYIPLLHGGAGRTFACLPGHEVSKLHDVQQVDASFVVQAAPRFKNTLPKGVEGRVYQTALFAEVDDKKLGPVSDASPLALALGAARDLGVQTVYLVGFDGYVNASRAQQALAQEIQQLLTVYAQTHPQVHLLSLTPTTYQLKTDSVYRLISHL